MYAVTLEYNQSNALERRKHAALPATGLFLKKDFSTKNPPPNRCRLIVN